MIYAGIGSRETPPDIIDLMIMIGHELALQGHILRSGGAPGADQAFERGCIQGNGQKTIFLPWSGFEGRRVDDRHYFVGNHPDAENIAARFHPAWRACSMGAKRMHSRNVYQVLGLSLSQPSDLIICWTKNGKGGGGTGQALRIAAAHDIPIYDLANPEALDELKEFFGV